MGGVFGEAIPNPEAIPNVKVTVLVLLDSDGRGMVDGSSWMMDRSYRADRVM